MVPSNDIQVVAFNTRKVFSILHGVDQIFWHDFHTVFFYFPTRRYRQRRHWHGSASCMHYFLMKQIHIRKKYIQILKIINILTWPMSNAATSSFSVSNAKLWHTSNTSSDMYTSVNWLLDCLFMVISYRSGTLIKWVKSANEKEYQYFPYNFILLEQARVLSKDTTNI